MVMVMDAFDRPWENPSNRQLRDAVEAMTTMVDEMRAARQAAAAAKEAAAKAASSSVEEKEHPGAFGIADCLTKVNHI